MTCRQIADFLDAYFANALPVLERLTFEAHLAICRDCRDYLDGYDKTIAASRAALQVDVPPAGQIPENLVAAILKSRLREK